MYKPKLKVDSKLVGECPGVHIHTDRWITQNNASGHIHWMNRGIKTARTQLIAYK